MIGTAVVVALASAAAALVLSGALLTAWHYLRLFGLFRFACLALQVLTVSLPCMQTLRLLKRLCSGTTFSL